VYCFFIVTEREFFSINFPLIMGYNITIKIFLEHKGNKKRIKEKWRNRGKWREILTRINRIILNKNPLFLSFQSCLSLLNNSVKFFFSFSPFSPFLLFS